MYQTSLSVKANAQCPGTGESQPGGGIEEEGRKGIIVV
jgi:hypothetical protein